jgi:hypothetical protein
MWWRGEVMQKMMRQMVRIVVMMVANLFRRTAMDIEARMRMIVKLPRMWVP